METTPTFSAKSLQYYVIAKSWASDLEFFKMETSFLNRLLDEYFLRLYNRKLTDKVKGSGQRLLCLAQNEVKVNHLICQQLKEMEWVAKNKIKENEERTSLLQVEIESQMVNIMCEFRDLKTDIFELVENILRDERRAVN